MHIETHVYLYTHKYTNIHTHLFYTLAPRKGILVENKKDLE